MELLDDHIAFKSDLTRESIKTMYELRQECSHAVHKVNNARLTLIIVCGFSLLSTIGTAMQTDDPTILSYTLGGMLIFGILAAIPLRYTKYSLSIALVIYGSDFLIILLINPTFALISFLLKGFIIYFIGSGMIAAFRIRSIQKKLLPYHYDPLSVTVA